MLLHVLRSQGHAPRMRLWQWDSKSRDKISTGILGDTRVLQPGAWVSCFSGEISPSSREEERVSTSPPARVPRISSLRLEGVEPAPNGLGTPQAKLPTLCHNVLPSLEGQGGLGLPTY